MSDEARPATLRAAWPALLLAALVILPFLGARDLWAPDEPRYAEVAREIVTDGHWWYPHANAVPYPDKPPLYFWLEAIASLPGGEVTELTARIPSAIAALLLVLVVADLGTRLLSAEAGRVAALVMATTWLAAWMARRVNLDVLLSLCVATCLWCGVRASLRARGGGSAGGVTAWMAGAGAAAALGVMTKGPVALLFLAAALIPMVLQARRDGVKLPLAAKVVTGVAFVAVLAAWLVPARLIGGYDPIAVVWEHFINRGLKGRDHIRPPWYYLGTVPLDFLPWTPLAIAAIWAAWKARREAHLAWLLSWALVPLVLLSISVEKRNIYVLPLLPAWALLVGWWVARRANTAGRLVSLLGWGARLAGGALIAAAFYLAFGKPLHRLPGLTEAHVMAGAVALTALAVVALVVVGPPGRETARARALGRVAAGMGAVLLAIFMLLPAFDPYKSARTMGATIARETDSAPLAMYPRTWDAYVFYSHRSMSDVTSPGDLDSWLAISPRPAYVLAYRQDEAVLTSRIERPVEVAHDDVGHREVVLWKFVGPTP